MTTILARDAAIAAPGIALCRHHFPLLRQIVNGKPIVYLDNAATSQTPQVVIDAMMRYYEEENANIHRGIHYLSERATLAYEGVRSKVKVFINAAHEREIIFVRGTTEAINLVAGSYGRKQVGPGDEVLISAMEHHSNIVGSGSVTPARKNPSGRALSLILCLRSLATNIIVR